MPSSIPLSDRFSDAATVMTFPSREPSDRQRVLIALRQVEEAQATLREACATLSAVPHFGGEYEALCRLEDVVHDGRRDLDAAFTKKRRRLAS